MKQCSDHRFDFGGINLSSRRKVTLWFGAILLWTWTSMAAAQRVVELCYDQSPPYMYTGHDGELRGYSVLLAQRLFARIPGYQLKLTSMPWARCQHAARTGKVDGVLQIQRNSERDQYYWFSEVLLQSQVYAYFRAEKAFSFNDVLQLQYYRVAWLRGNYISIPVNQAIDHGGFSFVTEVTDSTALFEMLAKDHADVTFFEQQAARWWLNKLVLSDKVVASNKPIAQTEWRIALTKTSNNINLMNSINKILANWPLTERQQLLETPIQLLYR